MREEADGAARAHGALSTEAAALRDELQHATSEGAALAGRLSLAESSAADAAATIAAQAQALAQALAQAVAQALRRRCADAA